MVRVIDSLLLRKHGVILAYTAKHIAINVLAIQGAMAPTAMVHSSPSAFLKQISVMRSGPVFDLLSWSPNHLEFSLQVTWSFSVFTPSDLEAKWLGEIPSDFSCWLGYILSHSNIIICILYLFKFTCVTWYGMFYNIMYKRQSEFSSLINYVLMPLAPTAP